MSFDCWDENAYSTTWTYKCCWPGESEKMHVIVAGIFWGPYHEMIPSGIQGSSISQIGLVVCDTNQSLDLNGCWTKRSARYLYIRTVCYIVLPTQDLSWPRTFSKWLVWLLPSPSILLLTLASSSISMALISCWWVTAPALPPTQNNSLTSPVQTH